MTHLRGIAWAHSRGWLPVLATAQRYMEQHPDVKIDWDARSLKAFGDEPVDELAARYDLVVLDHPWMGFADEKRCFLPLEAHLDAEFLADQQRNTVGRSYESYCYNGHQYALAIDAACPIAVWASEKIDHAPKTWDEVETLAREGRLICAGTPTGALMQFYMLLARRTDQLFADGQLAPEEEISGALAEMRAFFDLLPKLAFDLNPIQVYELLSDLETPYVYGPFDFGYSNYSRDGYAQSLLVAADVVSRQGKPLRTVLGGAGLAISASCKALPEALDYARFTAEGRIQQTLYAENGGQPGHRAAWTSRRVNELTHGFFENTLPTLDRAILRPRFPGYLNFQETAGPRIRAWLMEGGSEKALAEELRDLFAKSQEGKQ